MLKIYVARHGQDEDNKNGILNGRRNSRLTKLGEEQAMSLAKMIKEARIVVDVIYSSPLDRAYNTAKIVANELGVEELYCLGNLVERDFGDMTGKPIKDVTKYCNDVMVTDTITYFLSAENAETFPQLLDRAMLVLYEVKQLRKGAGGNILLVAHGDIGKMLFAQFYGLNWKSVLSMFHFGNSELLLLSEDCKPENACVFRAEQFNL